MPKRPLLVVAALLVSATWAQAQVMAGPELRANTYTTGAQARPAVAVQPNGDFIVVWDGDLQDGAAFGVFGQRFARGGSARGSEFQVNSYTTAFQGTPDVAVNRAGTFVVVWQSYAQDGDSGGIFGQRYDPTGARAGAEFLVNSATAGHQYHPGVAMDAKGGFVVTWTSSEGDGPGNYGIRAQRFNPTGAPAGAEFLVNTFTTSSQDRSKLAMVPDGAFVVVWESTGLQDGNSYGVFGQRFDATGTAVGAEFQANSYTTGTQGYPSVGMAADGSFVVAWESNEGAAAREVRTQRFDAAGNRVGGEFQVNTYTTGNQSVNGIAVDPQGNYTVIWDDLNRDGSNFGLFGWRISSTDTRRGVEFQANTYTSGYQGRSNLGVDEVGNYVVFWHSDQEGTDGGRGVYGQRFGGLYTAGLAVDPTGNGLLEPDEAAEVRPSWTNLSGASRTFGATLSGLTGPAGPTYSITDATADYGTVADAATAPCTNCFGVSISGTRPATHWDASALESITPDTLGQQKTWRLHVGASFADVPTSNPYYRFVETLLHHSVTGGCSATDYCPASSATREQMAVFVLAAKEGQDYAPQACGGTPQFSDVPTSSPFCRWVEELARRGVVSGCGGGNYCPTGPVTREQMAVFTLLTLDPTLSPPACTTPMFADVPASSPFCRWVEELANRGVVSGCGDGNYCPTSPVSREQMGVFISVSFGLTLYGP